MSTNLRIDIREPSDSLIRLIEEATNEMKDVVIAVSETDEYQMSGRKVAKFVAISIAAGLIGDASYDLSKELLHKVITIVGEQAAQTKVVITLTVDGVHFDISDAKAAAVIEQDLKAALKKG